jgi:hypothetical protein
MAKRSDLRIFGFHLLASFMLLASTAIVARADAVERLDEQAIKTMMRQLDAAAAARDIAPWAARLAPECDVTVHVTVFGTPRTAKFSRREYLDMTMRAWSDLAEHKASYTYTGGSVTVRLDSGGMVAVVTGRSTETLTYPDGRKLETSSMNTMRVELRGGRLAIVSINAVEA